MTEEMKSEAAFDKLRGLWLTAPYVRNVGFMLEGKTRRQRMFMKFCWRCLRRAERWISFCWSILIRVLGAPFPMRKISEKGGRLRRFLFTCITAVWSGSGIQRLI
jgi:hypothetical protein